MTKTLRLSEQELTTLRFALESRLNEIAQLYPHQHPQIQQEMEQQEKSCTALLKKTRGALSQLDK